MYYIYSYSVTPQSPHSHPYRCSDFTYSQHPHQHNTEALDMAPKCIHRGTHIHINRPTDLLTLFINLVVPLLWLHVSRKRLSTHSRYLLTLIFNTKMWSTHSFPCSLSTFSVIFHPSMEDPSMHISWCKEWAYSPTSIAVILTLPLYSCTVIIAPYPLPDIVSTTSSP